MKDVLSTSDTDKDEPRVKGTAISPSSHGRALSAPTVVVFLRCNVAVVMGSVVVRTVMVVVVFGVERNIFSYMAATSLNPVGVYHQCGVGLS